MTLTTAKRIVIPTYIDSSGKSDLSLTGGWETKYLEDENFEVVIYEKSNDLTNTEHREGNVTRIPNIGRSSFVFLWHIVNNYGSLLETEVFTKTHVSRQQIDIDLTIKESHKFSHLQAVNYCRMMLYVSQEDYDKHFDTWVTRGPVQEAVPTAMYLRLVNPLDAFRELDIKFMDLHCIRADALVYPFVPGLEDYPAAHALKDIFGDDYKFPYPFCLRRENVWSVNKATITSNPLSLYKRMLKYTMEDKQPWNMDHDNWCLFWPLFWEETIRRAGLKSES